MADDQERIRQCVREELELNLVSRTRNLIRSAAASTARELGQAFPASTSNQGSQLYSATSPSVSSGDPSLTNTNKGKRSRPFNSHTLRFKKSKPEVKVQKVPKTVWLLEKPSEEVELTDDGGSYEDYSLTDDMVLLKGEFDLVSNHTEEEIRRELEAVFSRKFPNICMYDFEFVKRERNVVSTPVVKESHKWDYGHVKHLCGNGRLYVRLLTADREEISAQRPKVEIGGNPSVATCSQNVSTSGSRVSTLLHPAPSTSATMTSGDEGVDISSIQQKINNLSAVFPSIPLEVVRNAITTHGSIDSAVNALLTYRQVEESGEPSTSQESPNNTAETNDTEGMAKSENLPQIFQQLKGKMHQRGTREKLKVDLEDQVVDVYTYYKSPDFDPSAPISVFVRGQPAIDTGGVLRQVFSEVFLSLSQNKGIKNIFIGDECRKVPVFSNELVVNGFFEILGKMVAHSLVQGGPGFPFLAPPIYWYLATGDLHAAIIRTSCADVSDQDLIKYIEQITYAPDKDLSAITHDSDFIRLMCEAGETRLLMPDNKLDILQSLMLHDILVKRKSILDQFRKGLMTLGLLSEMEKNPALFEECFVHQADVSNDSVAKSLHFPVTGDADALRVFQMMQSFVRNCSKEDLNDLLKYVTGSTSSAILPHRISVSCENSNSIFASTCLLELKLPSHFANYAEFEAAMRSVIKGSTFTTG